MAISASKRSSIMLIAVIYLIVFLATYFIFPFLSCSSVIINLFIADVIATVMIFIFSMIFNNSSIYDPYWSVVPPIIAIYLMIGYTGANHLRQLVIITLVLCWSFRLTFNWQRGWQGLGHQDWRYTSIEEKTGKWYWPVSFLGIHFMPTLFVFLGCLPLRYSLSSAHIFNVFDVVAALVTFLAILTEWVADEQLYRFRKAGNRNVCIQSGLWQYSRHPNYLGEIGFWGGMFLFVLSAWGLKKWEIYWTLIGFTGMVILFTGISIPMMEKRNMKRKPGYLKYAREVPALIPRFSLPRFFTKGFS